MPVVLTLALHLVVAGLLMVRWANPVTIEARTSAPVAIKATLVSADTLKPKPKPKPNWNVEAVVGAYQKTYDLHGRSANAGSLFGA